MRAEGPASRDRRVVIDTNIWLSAALSARGAPSELVQKVLSAGVPVFSDATFAELESRLWKPKFDRYISVQMRHALLQDARVLGFWVEPSPALTAVAFCRDADDDKFIHAAQAASAGWLVTGDQDLLVITGEVGVNIVTAADALRSPLFCK
jgi:putative PIN family toxin of toxin-antitoxin system